MAAFGDNYSEIACYLSPPEHQCARKDGHIAIYSAARPSLRVKNCYFQYIGGFTIYRLSFAIINVNDIDIIASSF